MKRKAHRLAREFLWACSNPKSVPDPDSEIRGEGARASIPLEKGGAVSKNIFWALRALVWFKNKGGPAPPPGPSPGSATANDYDYEFYL